MSKISAPSQDFSGQDSGFPSSSPDAEAANSHDGGTAGVNSKFVPSIDDPSKREAVSTVFQSDDPRLHLSRMSGEDPPNPVGYRGPDRRHI